VKLHVVHAIRYRQFATANNSGSSDCPSWNRKFGSRQARCVRFAEMANKMSKSLKDKLTAAIGPLLRSERRGRRTQGGGPMKNESISLAVDKSSTAVVRGKASAGVAPVEAVGRALGYTEKELLLAGEVLNRLVWRYPVSDDREKTLEAKAHKAA